METKIGKGDQLWLPKFVWGNGFGGEPIFSLQITYVAIHAIF